MSGFNHRPFFVVLLAGLTISFYYRVFDLGFLIVDDHVYVTNNPHVLNGLTWETIRWAFTTIHAEFWHPLTWLSLMLDSTLFGSGPAGYHFTNLILHVASSVILFLTFEKMTGLCYRSFVLAALFALHPLHIEAVAWIGQRKEVLCGFFWISGIYAYFLYTRKPGPLRYGIVVVIFFMGLMSKSMIVTFPFALLLLDVWPLQRWHKSMNTSKLLIEKLPLFAIASLGIGLTLFAQSKGGGVVSLETYSITNRVANAVIGYQAYLSKTFLPTNLSVFYPFRTDFTLLELSAALIMLSSVSLLAIALFSRKPYLLIGWCWFLGTLVPVIGIVKIGDFGMADRYMYMPILGILFAMVWLVADTLDHNRIARGILTAVTIAIIILFGSVTHTYLQKWQNNEILFVHAADVSAPNFFAHYSLGLIYARKGLLEEAEIHFRKAVAIRPDKQTLWLVLGRSIGAQGRFVEASTHFQTVIDMNQDNIDAYYYLGLSLLGQGGKKEGAGYLMRVIELQNMEKLHDIVQNCPDQGDVDSILKCLKIDDSASVLQDYMVWGYQHWIERIF